MKGWIKGTRLTAVHADRVRLGLFFVRRLINCRELTATSSQQTINFHCELIVADSVSCSHFHSRVFKCVDLTYCLHRHPKIQKPCVISHHYDGDASSDVSHHSDGGLLFRDQHWKATQTVTHTGAQSPVCDEFSASVCALHGISMLG